MEEKNKFSKLFKTFNKKGFYILLFVCLCIVAITAIYVSHYNANIVKKMSLSIANTQKITSGIIEPDLNQEKINSIETSKQQVKSTKDIAKAMARTKKSSTKKIKKLTHYRKFILSYPVSGVLTKKFDNKELQYSKTMQQWETHEGIDIGCDLGTEVKAALDGKIADVIKEDDTLTELGKDGYGAGIIIDHGDGYRTEYLNLASESLKLKKGEIVKKGQIIGCVGATSLREDVAIEGSHLYFAVLKREGKNYVNVDPLKFIK